MSIYGYHSKCKYIIYNIKLLVGVFTRKISFPGYPVPGITSDRLIVAGAICMRTRAQKINIFLR